MSPKTAFGKLLRPHAVFVSSIVINLRKLKGLKKHYAGQGVRHLGLGLCQFFGGVLSHAHIGALVLVTPARLEADIKWEQPVVIQQTLAPNGKITVGSNPNLRIVLDDVWIHVMADAKSQNHFSAVDHKPRGSVIATELYSDVVEVLHKERSYGAHSRSAIGNWR